MNVKRMWFCCGARSKARNEYSRVRNECACGIFHQLLMRETAEVKNAKSNQRTKKIGNAVSKEVSLEFPRPAVLHSVRQRMRDIRSIVVPRIYHQRLKHSLGPQTVQG